MQTRCIVKGEALSGPLNRLNAILSLLHPLACYRTPSAIGSAIGRPHLALSRMHAQVGVLDCLVGPSSKLRSGKTDPVQFKGVSNRAGLFAYKHGRFAKSFLLLGIGFLEASKKANLSFKSPSPKPHLNGTGSGFALPINRLGGLNRAIVAL